MEGDVIRTPSDKVASLRGIFFTSGSSKISVSKGGSVNLDDLRVTVMEGCVVAFPLIVRIPVRVAGWSMRNFNIAIAARIAIPTIQNRL